MAVQGTEVNYGRIAVVPAGDWDASRQYRIGDEITYTDGIPYLAHTEPPVGTLPTDKNYWQQAGAKGEKGDPGANGRDGAPGADGRDGVSITKIEQTTTSTEPGGENVITVTLSDGSAFDFTTRNGNQGPPGDGAKFVPVEVLPVENYQAYPTVYAVKGEGNVRTLWSYSLDGTLTQYGGSGSGGGDIDINSQTPAFAEAAERGNIESGETIPTLFGKIKKWFSDLKSVAFTGEYKDLSGAPEIPSLEGYATQEWVGQQGYIASDTEVAYDTPAEYTPPQSGNPVKVFFGRVTRGLDNLFSTIGTLALLSTAEKSSLVAAINELSEGKFDKARLVASANITEPGFAMDGATCADALAQLNSKLGNSFFITTNDPSEFDKGVNRFCIVCCLDGTKGLISFDISWIRLQFRVTDRTFQYRIKYGNNAPTDWAGI